MYMNSVENVLKIMIGNGMVVLYMFFFFEFFFCKSVLIFFIIKCNVDIFNIYKFNDGRIFFVNYLMLK